MHGHFSRVTFDALDRFSAVVALQGRVSVEADHNEHTAIVQHYLRTLVTDLLGPHAWPSDAAFEIGLVPPDGGGEVEDLTIGPGRCYVEGILVENPAPGASFYHQPDARFGERQKIPKEYPYFVYLEVWERLVTFIEEPGMSDVALGAGRDSSARAKVVWQIRVGDTLQDAPLPSTRTTALNRWWKKEVDSGLLGQPSGELTVVLTGGKDDELCALAPGAGYRGLENQLYRVEIHHGGALNGGDDVADASFKWSRDNGSVVFPIMSGGKGPVVKLATLGLDDRYSLDLGDSVELVDDASVLNGEPLALRTVIHIDPKERLVTLDAAPERVVGSDPDLHPLLRRWDHQPPSSKPNDGAGNALKVAAGPIALEDGIEVEFADGTYRAGDYWVFPARVETGSIEWPQQAGGKALSRPPHGVRRSYVPLALVKRAKAADVGATAADVVDLRPKPFKLT